MGYKYSCSWLISTLNPKPLVKKCHEPPRKDSMLDPKGNTAVYVLYAYARIAGVLRRADFEVATSPLGITIFFETFLFI